MATTREGPNPLRPYYIPPSVGPASEALPNSSSSIPKQAGGGSSSSPFSLGDLDYSEYLPDSSPSISRSVKDVVDKTLWKYASVLTAQPFEVAKLILQVYVAQDEETGGPLKGKNNQYGFEGDEYVDSSDDEPNFFTSNTRPPDEPSFSPTRGRSGRPRPAHGRNYQSSPTPAKSQPTHRLTIKNPHSLFDALSALSSHSGALSLWRATNTTFFYTILQRTFETFFSTLLAAVLGMAEADISHPSLTSTLPATAILTSTAPVASVVIATAASTFTSILLSPIDTARTRLILTPASVSPRSLLATIRTLPSPSYLIPPHLIPITFFTSTMPALLSSATPLILKNYLNIDPVLNPSSWSVATFTLSAVELLIRYPLETVLRRAQIATWTAPPGMPPIPSSSRKVIDTIVPVPQSYRGIVPTMWSIVKDEGTSGSEKGRAIGSAARHPRHSRKGQGIEGLYRGWRVGMWGLVGVWGAAFIGGMQSGVDTAVEGIPTHGKKF